MDNKNTMAFPKGVSGFDGHQGLTKLEYFTARAMQGLLSNSEWMKEYKGEKFLMQSDIVAEVAIKIGSKVLDKLSDEFPRP